MKYLKRMLRVFKHRGISRFRSMQELYYIDDYWEDRGYNRLDKYWNHVAYKLAQSLKDRLSDKLDSVK